MSALVNLSRIEPVSSLGKYLETLSLQPLMIMKLSIGILLGNLTSLFFRLILNKIVSDQTSIRYIIFLLIMIIFLGYMASVIFAISDIYKTKQNLLKSVRKGV